MVKAGVLVAAASVSAVLVVRLTRLTAGLLRPAHGWRPEGLVVAEVASRIASSSAARLHGAPGRTVVLLYGLMVIVTVPFTEWP